MLLSRCDECYSGTRNLMTYTKMVGGKLKSQELAVCYSCYKVLAKAALAQMNKILGRG